MSTDSERDLAQEIASLDNLTIDGLKLQWQNRFGRAASDLLPKALLVKLYAYREQADRYGGLSPGTIALLDRLGRERTAEGKSTPLPADLNGRDRLKAGTVLIREYAGASHHVMVTKDGYSWNGQTFSSLSQVATAITGTRWNGPRFFGLQSGRSAP